MSITPLSQVQPKPVEWLWPNRIALGKVALIDGDPGLGKSLLTLDLCARVSKGRGFPHQAVADRPGNAVVFNAEDSLHDVLVPRLQRLGADFSRVFIPAFPDGDSVQLPRDMKRVCMFIEKFQPKLMVFDPVVAFLGPSVSLNSDASLRLMFAPLLAHAAQHKCAVVLVRHLNKRGGGNALYRGTGSIGLMGLCRSAWLVSKSRTDPDRRVFAQLKNNLAPEQPSLGFTLSDAPGESPLTWTGVVAEEADELVRPVKPRAPSRRKQARDFLETLLADQPLSTSEIWEATLKTDFSQRTLLRAKRDLGISDQRYDVEGVPKTFWVLPGTKLVSRYPDALDPEELFGDMFSRYPPRTPLDPDFDYDEG